MGRAGEERWLGVGAQAHLHAKHAATTAQRLALGHGLAIGWRILQPL